MRLTELIQEPNLEINTISGSQLTAELFSQLSELISSGNEVDMVVVERNLKKAPIITYALVDGEAVGVVVLKSPVPSYQDKVFNAANVDSEASKYHVEVGYAYVSPEFRGVGSIKMLRAMGRAMTMPVFATTREANSTINSVLKYAGFRQLGDMYQSDRGGYNLILWGRG